MLSGCIKQNNKNNSDEQYNKYTLYKGQTDMHNIQATLNILIIDF